MNLVACGVCRLAISSLLTYTHTKEVFRWFPEFEKSFQEAGMPLAVEGAVPLLTVFDVPASIAFYRDVPGFEVVMHSSPFTNAKDDYGWAMLRLNGVELMVNNAYENNIRPTAPEVSRIAAHRDTALYLCHGSALLPVAGSVRTEALSLCSCLCFSDLSFRP
jgi:hypothetical protein